jgi:hypothetical protein
MNRNNWLIVGGLVAVGLVVVGVYYSQSSASSTSNAPQNAVNPSAQIGAGATAQGTMPDIGNLLSYNQVPGVMSAPQATSVDPYSSNYGVTGG